VPTFAAMKLVAWSDRHAPRDLFDLAGLATRGTLHDPNVARIFEAKMGVPIIAADFARVPARTADAWNTELAAQVGVLPSAVECLERVRAALAAVA
ncbi:MAG TPA: nucleotidyl transferase AbiEii/AbiGii toxin family protein, partial [Acidimicrobiia bacterium]